MSRRPRPVPVRLDAGDIESLPAEEIRLILRGADELIMSGGRTLLAKILKGSKEKKIRELGLDASPAWGALRELKPEQISARIDWLILHGYLDIEYDGRLPLLVYTPRGWAIERETFAAEWLDKIERHVDGRGPVVTPAMLNELNREVVLLILDHIEARGEPKYHDFLETWQADTFKKVRQRIRRVLQSLKQASTSR
ncbi:MAG: RQC-minor-1 family DNA-binding protein [Alphaproteobacteria bacterium]